mmetsp:Transcript_5405/g.15898  ORF Transcript_5405/g.15898 Transcript_5405/m.15898 type:complete len:280 (-) Transcript_5405:1588-2427(-)
MHKGLFVDGVQALIDHSSISHPEDVGALPPDAIQHAGKRVELAGVVLRVSVVQGVPEPGAKDDHLGETGAPCLERVQATGDILGEGAPEEPQGTTGREAARYVRVPWSRAIVTMGCGVAHRPCHAVVEVALDGIAGQEDVLGTNEIQDLRGGEALVATDMRRGPIPNPGGGLAGRGQDGSWSLAAREAAPGTQVHIRYTVYRGARLAELAWAWRCSRPVMRRWWQQDSRHVSFSCENGHIGGESVHRDEEDTKDNDYSARMDADGGGEVSGVVVGRGLG